MPVFDQSVARHVGFDLSKMRTPSSMSEMIASLDSSNSRLSSSFHRNGVPGFSDSRNGSMRSVAEKAYDTWLTKPNQERMSVMLLGVGKWRIASRYFAHGRTLSGVISNPANSTVSAAKVNLSGLRVMPCLPHMSSQLTAWWKLLVMSSAHSRVSSIHLVLSGMWETISSNLREYPSPDAMYPWGGGVVPVPSPWGDEGGEVAVGFV